MKKKLRVFLIGTAGAVGLALAAVALGGSSASAGFTVRRAHMSMAHALAAKLGPSAYTQNIELAVQQGSYKLGAASNPGFAFLSDPSNDATAKMTIFSPAGYASNLAHAPGSTVGQAFAIVRAGVLGGADLPLSGPVVVGDPANPQLQAAYQLCKSPTDPATPQLILVLTTSLQGQTITVPDFVNAVPNTPYVTQEICLQSPQDPANTFQAQLWYANFTINGVFTNAPTSAPAPGYQWVGDFTPYTGTTPDPARTIELRSYVGLPSSLTFKRVKSKPKFVKFAGKLSINGVNPRGIRVAVFFGAKSQPAFNFLKPGHCIIDSKGCRFVRTKGVPTKGSYTLTRPKVKKKTYFQAFLEDGWFLADSSGNPTCDGPSPNPSQPRCILEILSPMISNQVKVSPPRKKRHHR